MENNGLKLFPIKSKPQTIDRLRIEDFDVEIEKRIKDNSDCFVVLYLDYKVIIGRYVNGAFQFFNNERFERKYIRKIRIFNQDQELLLWRTSNAFKGRFRVDETGDDVYVVDAEQVLFGTEKEKLKGYTRIFEKRATELILPFQGLSMNDKKDRVFIRTRNYIGSNEVNQATYVDCRFMGFKNAKF